MLIPAVMHLEMAQDMLQNVSKQQLENQQHELTCFGDGRAVQLGASGLTEDFRKGYELGLETARALLLMVPGIEMAREIAKKSPGVDLNDAAYIISMGIRNIL